MFAGMDVVALQMLLPAFAANIGASTCVRCVFVCVQAFHNDDYVINLS